MCLLVQARTPAPALMDESLACMPDLMLGLI